MLISINPFGLIDFLKLKYFKHIKIIDIIEQLQHIICNMDSLKIYFIFISI